MSDYRCVRLLISYSTVLEIFPSICNLYYVCNVRAIPILIESTDSTILDDIYQINHVLSQCAKGSAPVMLYAVKNTVTVTSLEVAGAIYTVYHVYVPSILPICAFCKLCSAI